MARSKKEKSYDQAAAMQQKAVRFLRDVVGDQEKADEIESLSVSEYADRKGLVLTNPASTLNQTQRRNVMSTVFMENPAGEEQEVDLSTLPKPDLFNVAVGLRNSLKVWEDTGIDISDAVIDFEDGKISAQELADEVWEALCEADPDLYESDDEAETEEDEPQD